MKEDLARMKDPRTGSGPIQVSDAVRGVGVVTSDLLHALRNPVAAFKTSLELLVSGTVDAEDLPQLHRVLKNEVGKLTDLLGRCSELTELTGLTLRAADLTAIVRASVDGHAAACTEQGVRVEYRSDADAMPLQADATLFERAVDALVDNAIEAMSSRSGTLTVTLGHTADGFARLQVIDTGVGISPTVLPNVFRLFYTTKKGSAGMGLPVARQIFTAHGGRIEIVSAEGQGTEVTVRVPIGA